MQQLLSITLLSSDETDLVIGAKATFCFLELALPTVIECVGLVAMLLKIYTGNDNGGCCRRGPSRFQLPQ